MIKIKHLPQYIILLLLILLAILEGWTYYLGTPKVTFKRLIGSSVYPQIEDISLRRYKKGKISPHLFNIKTKDQRAVLTQLIKDCKAQEIDSSKIPNEVKGVDKEMIVVVQKSPYIYLSKSYNLSKPKEGRMCLIFSDKDSIYLFINGNLE